MTPGKILYNLYARVSEKTLEAATRSLNTGSLACLKNGPVY
jgi:hypothetical protein